MKEAKFTPGPWDAAGDVILGDDQQVGLVISSKESDYNAALIAAAPDMYEALCAVMDDAGDPIAVMAWETQSKIYDALDKARGES